MTDAIWFDPSLMLIGGTCRPAKIALSPTNRSDGTDLAELAAKQAHRQVPRRADDTVRNRMYGALNALPVRPAMAETHVSPLISIRQKQIIDTCLKLVADLRVAAHGHMLDAADSDFYVVPAPFDDVPPGRPLVCSRGHIWQPSGADPHRYIGQCVRHHQRIRGWTGGQRMDHALSPANAAGPTAAHHPDFYQQRQRRRRCRTALPRVRQILAWTEKRGRSALWLFDAQDRGVLS